MANSNEVYFWLGIFNEICLANVFIICQLLLQHIINAWQLIKLSYCPLNYVWKMSFLPQFLSKRVGKKIFRLTWSQRAPYRRHWWHRCRYRHPRPDRSSGRTEHAVAAGLEEDRLANGVLRYPANWRGPSDCGCSCSAGAGGGHWRRSASCATDCTAARCARGWGCTPSRSVPRALDGSGSRPRRWSSPDSSARRADPEWGDRAWPHNGCPSTCNWIANVIADWLLSGASATHFFTCLSCILYISSPGCICIFCWLFSSSSADWLLMDNGPD